MAILRPDLYEHNNSALPIIDINNTWGGMFILTGNSPTERYSISPSKLKNKQLVKNNIGELWELIDINQSTNASGWGLFSSSSGVTSGCCSDAVLYTNSAATYVDVGGIEDGSTFSAVTMQDMWTDLLYPNLNPSFNMFKIDGNSSFILDVGGVFSGGSKVATWSTLNSNFIQTDTIKIIDYTSSILLVSGLNNDESEPITLPNDITKPIRASHRWIIYGQKTNNMWFGRSLWANWYWRRYWGGNTNPSLSNIELTGLSNYLLTDVIDGDYSFSADSSYKYIVIPKVSGWRPIAGNPHHYWYPKTPEYVRHASTNLNIALAGPSDGYNEIINGLPYKTLSISNPHGFSTDCYVFRTKYMLGGVITMKVE